MEILAAAGSPGEASVDPSLAAWAILGAAIVVMLVIDLFVFARGKREVDQREAEEGRVWDRERARLLREES
jgi:hypothetical protein